MNGRFKEDEDVYLENLLPNLPGNFQSEVKELDGLSEDILVRICDALKPVFYDEHSYIVKEGDPIDAIFFITKGIAWTYATSNKGEGTVLKSLVEGQFFGGELLEWVKKSKNTWNDLSEFPVSSKILKTHTKVEAFALMAHDLGQILSYYKLWGLDREPLNSTAACKIQAAWRHHRDASRKRQDPVESKATSIFHLHWRRNRRKMDDSVDDLCTLRSLTI
uniref:Cyclic nucleotide-binding domain-containing protein n=1 Tax=Fagus sylvatica TaxID=28930 RepID=A0A2N9HUX9_FAGSY